MISINELHILLGLAWVREVVPCSQEEMVGFDSCIIRTIVEQEQDPPLSLIKLNSVAEKEEGWLQVGTWVQPIH